jgi:hypothetical protein
MLSLLNELACTGKLFTVHAISHFPYDSNTYILVNRGWARNARNIGDLLLLNKEASSLASP